LIHPGEYDRIISSTIGSLIPYSGIEQLVLLGNSNISVSGNNLDNYLIGNDGNNFMDGGLGNDTYVGGAGNDTYVVNIEARLGGGILSKDYVTTLEFEDSGTDTILVIGNLSLENYADISTRDLNFIDTFAGITVENYDISGTGSSKLNLIGNDINNILTGNNADNTINGLIGNDTLIGAGGNDTLIGGEGDDFIISGLGNDILTGGIGADTFVWNLADKGTNGLPAIDRITDFNIAEDRLDLRDLLVSESSGNILNYLDITTSTASGVSNTEIRISNTGGFAGGTFAAATENQHITLAGVNLLTGTNETDLLATLIAENKLIIDV
jgi:Ca2+-binding RTX toxin-like protein